MLYTLNLHFQRDIYFSALHIAIATTSGFQPFTITMKSAHTSTKRTDTKYQVGKNYQSINLTTEGVKRGQVRSRTWPTLPS